VEGGGEGRGEDRVNGRVGERRRTVGRESRWALRQLPCGLMHVPPRANARRSQSAQKIFFFCEVVKALVGRRTLQTPE
jgi:hypothetical protein